MPISRWSMNNLQWQLFTKDNIHILKKYKLTADESSTQLEQIQLDACGVRNPLSIKVCKVLPPNRILRFQSFELPRPHKASNSVGVNHSFPALIHLPLFPDPNRDLYSSAFVSLHRTGRTSADTASSHVRWFKLVCCFPADWWWEWTPCCCWDFCKEEGDKGSCLATCCNSVWMWWISFWICWFCCKSFIWFWWCCNSFCICCCCNSFCNCWICCEWGCCSWWWVRASVSANDTEIAPV